MSMNVELWLLKHMCECVKHVRPYSITQADFLYVFSRIGRSCLSEICRKWFESISGTLVVLRI